MGITVISSTSTAQMANSSVQTAGTPTDGIAAGFAALLTGQIKTAASLLAPNAAPGESKESSGKDETLDSESTPQGTLDPALAFLMATPAQAPTVTITSTATSNATTGITTSAADKSSSLLGNIKESALPQTGLATNPQPGIAEQLENTGSALKNGSEQSLAANIAADALLPAAGSQDPAAALNASALASQQKTAVQPRETTEIATPLHSANWSQSFSEKIVWLAKNDQQTAQININPPQLGPVQITLQLNGDQASAIFASPHAEVRQAIENSLPQLKEMLAGAGINLGQADVGANLAQQNREPPAQPANGNRLASENAILPGIGNATDGAVSTPIQRGRGMVDLFA